MRCLRLVVSSFVACTALVLACSSSSSDSKAPPSCDELQAQLNGCPAAPKAGASTFFSQCGKVSASCRSCLDGVLCGVTEQCDAVCTLPGADADAASADAAAPVDASAIPSCDELGKQVEACGFDSGRATFDTFCATSSPACRSCLNGTLCDVTEPCDGVCKK